MIFVFLFFGCKSGNKNQQKQENKINNSYEKFLISLDENEKLMIQKSDDENSLSCLVKDDVVFVPAEDVILLLNKTYEFCGRCGHIAFNLGNSSGDILLIEWNSPYVHYQNKEERIELSNNTIFENGKTYTEFSFFKNLGF